MNFLSATTVSGVFLMTLTIVIVYVTLLVLYVIGSFVLNLEWEKLRYNSL